VENKKHIDVYIRAALVVCLLVVLMLTALLVIQYRQLRAAEHLPLHHSLLMALHAKGSIQPSDAGLIQPWMTFDYVNHVFVLPSDYLSHALSISDQRYPRVTIAQAAEDAHVDPADMLERVQTSVRASVSSSTRP
jgi:hypothetical protein